MRIKPILYGLATYLPGMVNIRRLEAGGAYSARYCYSVWLRHLVFAQKNGLNHNPKIVAELGPGDSLGIGLAALVSGSERYFAFDVVEFANLEVNLEVFDELVTLFSEKSPIPGDDEFPRVKPRLDSYEFPAHILGDARLQSSLEQSRLERIKSSVVDPQSSDSMIQYKVPWFNSDVLEPECVDLIFSQAVLEHVDELEETYKAMFKWLKPDGYMSHVIDFKCHGMSNEWNGHWACSDLVWNWIRGRRPYLLNRAPHSEHIEILERLGFTIISDERSLTESNLSRDRLAPRFRNLTDEDIVTSGAFVQCRKST